MTATDAKPDRKVTRRTRLAIAFVVIAVLLLVLATGAYLARRAIARQAAAGWLEQRGVEAQVDFQRLTPTGLIARVRAGPRNDPDLVVERVEVTYDMLKFRRGRWLGPQVSAVRLVRPVVKARLNGGELSFGSLDPVIEEFRLRPPQPDAAKPRILVEQGQFRLLADFGQARVSGDARVEDGKLMALAARLSPASLAGDGFAVEVAGGAVDLTTEGDRAKVRAELRLTEGWVQTWTGRGLSLQVAGDAPYPDLERKRHDGQVRLAAFLRSGEVKQGDAALRRVDAEATFAGTSQGWLESLVLAGSGGLNVRADAAQAGGAQVRTLRLDARAPTIRWSKAGGSADLRLGGSAGRIAAQDIELRQVTAALTGGASADAEGPRFALSGRAAAASGAWAGLGAPDAADGPETAALQRALSAFQLSAPRLTLAKGPAGLSVRLPAPIRATSRSGAQLTVAERGAALQGASGGFAAQLRGGGLPALDLEASRYRLTSNGFMAATKIRGVGDFDMFRQFKAGLAGETRIDREGLRFYPRGCHAVSAQRLELGENDAVDVAGRLCGAGGPLFAASSDGWRLDARLQGVAVGAPFLEAAARDAAGRLQVRGAESGIRLDATITGATVVDRAAEARFNPVRATGEAHLAGDLWRGAFAVSDHAGHKLADALLRHDGRRGAGGVTFDTGLLTFAPGGLQPAELSPLAEAVASPASGQARFQGRMDWTETTNTSSGVLQIPGFEFRSPAGQITGVRGQVEFASLAPFATRGPQTLTAERVAFMTPLDKAKLIFELQPDALKLGGGEAALGGGLVRVEPLSIPLEPGKAWDGVLVLENVQLAGLVEQSPLADRLNLEAKVSGRLPFIFAGEGPRFVEGRLAAVEPGRISIERQALQGVVADGAEATVEGPRSTETVEPSQNAIVDLAYQAMEHLAFQSLVAEVNSLPNGRLGVLLKIEGEHAPPQRQRIRLSIIDLVRRRFLDKPLPLPSGTKVNLTLDTSLNLDQLLADYAAYQTRGSASVQAPPGKTE